MQEEGRFGKKIGEATLMAIRPYTESCVSDFVQILIANGYGVFIRKINEEKYLIEYYQSPLWEF